MNGAAARDKPTSFDLRTEFRIGTWNVLTLAKTGYTEAICQELSKYRISLAGLTETHLLGSGRLDIDDHTVIHSGEEQEHRRGVALVLDKKLSRSLVSWQAISSRILTARMLHKHGHLTVVVAYAPTEDSTMNSKDEFYITLESVVTSRPPHDQIVVLGDYNAVTGADRAGFEGVIGNFSFGCRNDNSLCLLTMCSAANLTILGSWF